MATYPPALFPGGYYYPSPCPYSFSSYPAPSSGFFPTPAYGAPVPFPYHHPPDLRSTPSSTSFHFGSSPASAYSPNQPPPAPTPSGTGAQATSSPTHNTSSGLAAPIPDWPPSAPIPIHGDLIHHHYPTTCSLSAASNFPVAPLRVLPDHDSSSPAHHTSLDHSPVREDPQPDAFWTAPNQKRRPSQSHASSKAASEVDTYLACDAAVHTVADERIRTSFSNGKFVQGQARLEQQQACDRTSFDAIQGQLAKLSSMLSQFAVSLGKQSTSADASKPEQSQHISIVPAPPAHVAPQVFGEMPTPTSWQGTHGTALDNSSGHHNATLSTCVPDGNNSLSEPNLDGMPQAYGLHSLNRQSVILADGTEHSYYALPENYPLERATPEPLSSNESVGVFASNPEQQPYQEAQQDSEQHPKCFSKPSKNPLPEVYSEFALTNNMDVPVTRYIKFKHGQCIPRVSEYMYTSDCVIGDVIVKDYNWNMVLSEEGREVWDPGASVPLMSSKLQHSSKALQCATHGTILAGSSVTRFSGCKCLPFWVQNIYVLGISEIGMKAYISWDPGILNILDMMLDKYTMPNNVQFIQWTAELLCLNLTTCTHYMAPNGINSILHHTPFILQRAAFLSQGNYFCSLYCNSVLKTEYCKMRCFWEFAINLATELYWDPEVTVTLHSYTVTHPVVTHISRSQWQPLWIGFNVSMWWNSSVEQTACLHWDPGPEIHWYEILWFAMCFDMASDNGFSEQSQVLKHPTDPELHTDWSLKITIGNYVTEHSYGDSLFAIQPTQLHQIHTQQCHTMLITEGIQDWDPGIRTPSSIHLLLQGLTARIATKKPLSWLPIPELTKWQSQTTSISFVWDPGTMFPWYKYKWWLLFKCSGVTLWLIHFRPP